MRAPRITVHIDVGTATVMQAHKLPSELFEPIKVMEPKDRLDLLSAATLGESIAHSKDHENRCNNRAKLAEWIAANIARELVNSAAKNDTINGYFEGE